jgi:hypothetical protein
VAFAVVKLKTRDTIDQQDRRHSTPCGQHRFEFRIADEQEPTAEEVRDSFGADCLTGPRRAREIEGKREPSGMACAEPPTIEDEIALCHLGQCEIKCAPSSWRQNNVIERSPRDDRLDRAAAGPSE